MSKLDTFTQALSTQFDDEVIGLEDFMERCVSDPSLYASPAERILKAIGEPTLLDTKNDPHLSRIFQNRIIRVYPSFSSDFYGMEDTIDQIVAYFRHASQGLEEAKQILYLLGPVGSSKSTLAEKIKELAEKEPVYILDGSPVFETPFGLFFNQPDASKIFGLPAMLFKNVPSPWAIEKIKEFKGDLSQFKVRKVYPSRLHQICIARVEPGDENNQDISTLVGELDIRMVGKYSQNHPYAYNFSGGLNRANNGVLEFVEMFKAPIKMLHPLLTATQEHMYTGTKAIGNMPFHGIIIAHSNESEWEAFRNNKTNEAFLDRVYLVSVPYVTRVDEEVKIYKKLLSNSALATAPCAPGTLETMAQFAVMSRLVKPENSPLYVKMRVYNGENLKQEDPTAKPLQEYKDAAGVKEGMNGISTRFAFKILSKTFNYDTEEIAANPIHLMYVLKRSISEEQLGKEKEQELLTILDGTLMENYMEFLEKDIRASFLNSFQDLCQNMFERYFYYADAWVSDQEYRDSNTGLMLDRAALNAELEKMEKPAGISNPKDFRNDVAMFIVRYKGANKGKMPAWNGFEKMRLVIEKNVLASTADILPVIAFTPKRTEEETKKHNDFVAQMQKLNYTPRQTRILVEFFLRAKYSN